MVSYSRVRTSGAGRAADAGVETFTCQSSVGSSREGRGPVGRTAHEQGGRGLLATSPAPPARSFVLTLRSWPPQAVLRDAADGVGGPADDLGQLGALHGVESGEDPVGDVAPEAGGRLANAHPDAHELGRAEALDHAPHPVVARVSRRPP